MATARKHLKRLGRAAWQVALVLLVLEAVHLFQTWGTVTGPAPALVARDIQGRQVDLAAYRGRSVLVHFWATWCPVCRLEADSIDALARDHSVITVAVDSGSAEAVYRYLAERQLEFPVVMDQDGRLSDRYGVKGVPTSFIVGPSGEVRFTEVGYTTGIGLRLRMYLSQVWK